MYKINVVSNEGHTEFAFETKEEAVEKAKEIATKDNKWLYVGSQFVNKEDLTPGMINEVDDITLTNPLAGG